MDKDTSTEQGEPIYVEGEVVGPQSGQNQGGWFLRFYNRTRNIGEVHKVVGGKDVEVMFFKIEEDREVIIPAPMDDKRDYHVSAANFETDTQLLVFDREHNRVVRVVPRTHVLHLDDTEIEFDHEDMTSVNDLVARVNGLSAASKARLKDALKKPEVIVTLERKKKSHAEFDEVARAVDDIISAPETIPTAFYKSIDATKEFGVSRFVADRVYHLPELLREPRLRHQADTNTYIVEKEIVDSQGNRIKIEHRFPSHSAEEAEKTAVDVIQRLQTVQHKIWLAAWKLANQLERLTYTCKMTELMRLYYPERTCYFSTKEKIQFYEDLRSLENTKIVFSVKSKTSGKKEIRDDYEIRLLEIEGKRGSQKEYPAQMTLTILNPKAVQNQRMAFVGAGFQNKTLELSSDDAMLAQVIQTRKNQRQGAKEIKFDREYLIELAGLRRTDESNKSVANKKLLEKLTRLREKGIVKNVPVRITDKVSLQIR